jgi:hypothetical protein
MVGASRSAAVGPGWPVAAHCALGPADSGADLGGVQVWIAAVPVGGRRGGLRRHLASVVAVRRGGLLLTVGRLVHVGAQRLLRRLRRCGRTEVGLYWIWPEGGLSRGGGWLWLRQQGIQPAGR